MLLGMLLRFLCVCSLKWEWRWNIYFRNNILIVRKTYNCWILMNFFRLKTLSICIISFWFHNNISINVCLVAKKCVVYFCRLCRYVLQQCKGSAVTINNKKEVASCWKARMFEQANLTSTEKGLWHCRNALWQNN